MATQFRLFLAYTLIPSLAFGFTIPCPAHSRTRQTSLLKKVAIMAEESRLTFAEYAKLMNLETADVQKMFSGLGVLDCSGYILTAQLTGSKDVITTAGHAFLNDKCSKINYQKPCKFKTVNPPIQVVEVKMNSVVAGCNPSSSEEDWAVAKLDRPIDGTPFSIPEDDSFMYADDNTSVTQISARSFNFKVGDAHPPTVQKCFVKETWHLKGVPIQTDCDNGGWSSGSAMLVGEPGSFTMAAMAVGEPKDRIDFLPYDRDKNFNYAVPVAGKFREAVLKMADQ